MNKKTKEIVDRLINDYMPAWESLVRSDSKMYVVELKKISSENDIVIGNTFHLPIENMKFTMTSFSFSLCGNFKLMTTPVVQKVKKKKLISLVRGHDTYKFWTEHSVYNLIVIREEKV